MEEDVYKRLMIVMADGGIKDISEILPGESIISDDGLPHQVSHVHIV